MDRKNIDIYNRNAVSYSEQYDSVPFEQVHDQWLDSVELVSSGNVLDIGSGSGRDAFALAQRGFDVVACEPAEKFLELAERNYPSPNITWLQDSLPSLNVIYNLDIKFDFILLSAVWMHIAPSDRARGFRKLSQLLKPNGKLIITLRHGPSPDERSMFSVSRDELNGFARQQGLIESFAAEAGIDQLKRDEVSWETVIFTLPDDGSGAFPLLRNIVVNDSKSSTYKLGLLRSLIRIAEGHPGAVINRSTDSVELPLGLVAFYWIKLYQPLVEKLNLHQNSNAQRGLGFITDSGWNAINTLGCEDFQIGDLYLNPHESKAIFMALKDAARTIQRMPPKYITLPNSTEQVFEVESKSIKTPKSMLIDQTFLASMGTFVVPAAIWDNLTRHSIWIEPAIIKEWAQLLLSFKANQTQHITLQYCLQGLAWRLPERSTVRVRKRVNELQKDSEVHCCWSNKRLSSKSDFAVDHCFPFARWPNNDLWNLLPSKVAINAKKSDKLPSAGKLLSAKDWISHWWRQAWEENKTEFFTQANLSLPKLHLNNESYEDVFEAMKLQRARLRDIQQLQEWK
jgi:SAM-dependent methyltransferase